MGFTPKFRAANPPKPVEETAQPKAEDAPVDEGKPVDEAPAKPKMGFTPKFRAANPPKPVEETAQPKADDTPVA